jgi:hypothetical protein
MQINTSRKIEATLNRRRYGGRQLNPDHVFIPDSIIRFTSA